MADEIQSNINININTSGALESIKQLQSQISAFHTQMAQMGAANAAQSANMRQNLINSINASGQFAASVVKIKTTTESFTEALEKNKLSLGEYFRYAGASTRTFGKLFGAEFDTINKVARERVKTLATQYIKLGRDANGAMQAIKVRPLVLDMESLATKTAIAAQRQQLLNQLLKQGSTNLLNFGKNTQWAGRQLMVGFTIPLTIMGGAAMKAYKQIEEAGLKLRRVYGDFSTTADETEKIVKQVQQLATEFTKYGVAVKDTMDMAATAAATGKKGADLLQQISNATKLSVLGQVDQAKALETTISLTNAFGIAAKDLKTNIDFLNAVENQTILNIEDMTTAIPKAAPVVKQLGGDIKDLAFFMTAMKEGGINASEGANALKSGLASLINPTGKAAEMLQGFGINIKKIVEGNQGDLKKTVVDFAKALDTLDPLNRARAIEQLFGKFQFSRMSTLFQNVVAQGTQAAEVLKLAGQSSLELSMLSQRELNKIQSSPLYKFQKSIADFQAQLAPIGEQFMKAVTPIIEFGSNILKQFNGLGDGVKQFIVKVVAVAGVIGPVLLMTFGLIANGVANIIKGFALVKDLFNKTGKSSLSLGEQVRYMTEKQLEAAAVAASLDQTHSKLRQTFSLEADAVNKLTAAYRNAVAAQQAFNVPIIPRTPNAGRKAFAEGGIVRGPGTGTSDSILARLSNGEAVIPAQSVAKHPQLINQLIAGNVPGYARGVAKVKVPQMMQGIIGPLSQRATESLARTAVTMEEISAGVLAGPLAKMRPTNYGTQISPTTGHSFPAFGVGGIYQKPDGTMVFVKPQMDLTSARAEMRGTKIARDVHGLVAPQQKLAVMMDPTDPDGKRRFIVLESPLDDRLANVPKTFTKDEYFTQLVASLLRGDKDLGLGNLGGNILADVGPAGVFTRASGARQLGGAINSMEQQAIINLLGTKGGAKKFFAQATSSLVSGMSPTEYDSRMKAEIDRVLPRLRKTISGFSDLTPEESLAYRQMIARLEDGRNVDWTRFQSMHSAVPPVAFARGGIVGGKKFNFTKPKASIFDIDDTLVQASELIESNRAKNELLPKDQRLKWYEELAKNPKGMEKVIERLRLAKGRGNKIILMTARPEAYRAATLETLRKIGIDPKDVTLIFRKDKDYRKPEQMKYEKTARYMQWYDIEEFYDDMDKTRGAIGLMGINAINPLKLARGGIVRGPGGPRDDMVPANLSNGEAVIDAETTRRNPRIIQALFAGKKINIPGYKDNNQDSIKMPKKDRAGSGASGRLGKSLFAFPINYKENVSNTSGALDVLDLEATLENISYAYAPEILKASGTSVAAINTEIDIWKKANQDAIKKATDLVNSGIPASEAFKDLSAKFASDMKAAAGPVHRFTETAKTMFPKLSQDFKEMQATAKSMGLDVRSGKDNAKLLAAIPNNMAAKSMNTPGNFGSFSKSRGAILNILGRGASAFSSTGVPRFMLDTEAMLNTKSTAYGLQMTQEHVSTTLQQEENKAKQRVIRSQSSLGKQAGESFSNAKNDVLNKEQNDSAIQSRSKRRRSPHPTAPQDGRDDGVAYQNAKDQAIAQTQSQNARKRQGRRVVGQENISGGQTTTIYAGGDLIGGQSDLGEEYLAQRKEEIAKKRGRLTDKLFERLYPVGEKGELKSVYNMTPEERAMLSRQRASSMMNKGFMGSMAAGMASMLPGPIGQVAGIASMVLGVGSIASGPLAKMSVALQGSTKGLGLVTKGLMRFVPGLGAAVIAFEAFDNLILPMIKKNADGFNGIAETLKITQDKIDKINNFFGTEIKLTGIRGMVVASGEQTKAQASIAQQFQQSQEFKDVYQADAQKLKGLTQAQFRRAMQAMAADLFGQGMENEQVKAIIDAIALEADKASVSIAPKLFSIKNPEAKAQMDKNIKEIFADISTSTQKIGGINPIGDAFRAARGEYDNYYLTPFDPESVAKIKAGTEEIASYVSALSGQFANGQISAKEFTIQYEKLIQLSYSQPGTSGIEALRAALFSLNEEAGKAVQQLNDPNFLKVFEALNLGVTPTTDAYETLMYGTDEQKTAQANAFAAAGKEMLKRQSEVNKLKSNVNELRKSSENIENIEKSINDKYDKRIKQIEKIKRLNQQISEAQEGQLTLAEALNRGDISAAARAAQEIQQTDIQNALENQQQALQDARDAELEPLNNKQEANTKAINNLTGKIDQLILEGITVKETSPGFKKPSEYVPQQLKDILRTVSFGLIGDEQIDSLTLQIANLFGINTQSNPSGGNGLASGGYIKGPGSGTSDSIPAMLSNGEYVIRANAVKTIGTDVLDKLNYADRMKFANGGMVRGYDQGGYVGPRPAPQWDDKGRWVVSRGESYWSTAEATLPTGMDVGSWWNRILQSNIDPTTGKERRLYRNSRIWIPGRLEPYPPQSGMPRIFKNKNKPFFAPEFKISESHAGQGAGGIGGGLFGFGPKLYSNGGMVRGYDEGGPVIPNPFSDTSNWINSLINSMFNSGGNPSGFLNQSAGQGTKGALSNIGQFYKDYVFDPSSPIDYAMAFLPGSKAATKVAGKVLSKFKYPLALDRKKVKITGGRLDNYTLITSSAGATPGAFREINGELYYIKKPSSKTQELVASTLWSQLGLGGPKLQALGKNLVASKIIPNLIYSDAEHLSKYIMSSSNKDSAANTLVSGLRKYFDEDMPVNALLGNTDTHTQNVLFNKKTGRFENIDLGITALSDSMWNATDSAKGLFKDEIITRRDEVVEALASSGFDFKEVNSLLGKYGIAKTTKAEFEMLKDKWVYFANGLNLFNGRPKGGRPTTTKDLTPQINKIAKTLGFDLTKPISSKKNLAAINPKTNKFVASMIKEYPELANALDLKTYPASYYNYGIIPLSEGLSQLFKRLQNTLKDPMVKFANGGMVRGYDEGGRVLPPPKIDKTMSDRWQNMGRAFGPLTPGQGFDMNNVPGLLREISESKYLTSGEKRSLKEYVSRPYSMHGNYFSYNRKYVGDAILRNKFTIDSGTPISRVANSNDMEILKRMKPGQSVILDRFMSVLNNNHPTSKSFIKDMISGTVDTGGRGANMPIMKFNVKTGIPGINDINNLIPEASNVSDGLLAPGIGMKLRKIRFENNSPVYYFDVGTNIKAKYGFNQLDIMKKHRNNSNTPPEDLSKKYRTMSQDWYREAKGQQTNDDSGIIKYIKSSGNTWSGRGNGGGGTLSNFGMIMSQLFADGGLVRGYAMGGQVSPINFTRNGLTYPKLFANGGLAMGTDTVPAMLTPGEFVIKKSAVERIGASTLNQINRFADGGMVGGGSSTASTSIGDSVYNYSISVNVSSQSDPNQIARVVMNEIKKIDNHRVRGSAF